MGEGGRDSVKNDITCNASKKIDRIYVFALNEDDLVNH